MMVIITLRCSFTNGLLQTRCSRPLSRPMRLGGGRSRVRAYLCVVCTTGKVHIPILCACQQINVVNDDLAQEGRLQECARVDGGRGRDVEEYGVVGVSVEPWRRMEMPFFEGDGGGSSSLLGGCEL